MVFPSHLLKNYVHEPTSSMFYKKKQLKQRWLVHFSVKPNLGEHLLLQCLG